MLTLDVVTLASLALGEQPEPEGTTWTGDRFQVGRPLPTVHPPAVHAVVVDGVSEGHLLVEEEPVLTGLEGHGAVLTLVELVAGGGICCHLNSIKQRAGGHSRHSSAQPPHLLHQLLAVPGELLAQEGGEGGEEESVGEERERHVVCCPELASLHTGHW